MNKRDSDILSLEPVVSRNARRFNRNFKHSSVDFLSVAWLTVIQEYDRGNVGAECTGYYSVVIRNRIIDCLRNEKVALKHVSFGTIGTNADEGEVDPVSPSIAPEAVVEYEELRVCLLRMSTKMEAAIVETAEQGEFNGPRPFAEKYGCSRWKANQAYRQLRNSASAVFCMEQ